MSRLGYGGQKMNMFRVKSSRGYPEAFERELENL
jgi:hypothetical protein